MEASCRGHFLKRFDKCDFDHLQLVMIFWAWPPTSSSDHNWPPNHMLLGSQPGNLPSLKPFLACINHAYTPSPLKKQMFVINKTLILKKKKRVTNQRSAPTNLKFLSFKLRKFVHPSKKRRCIVIGWCSYETMQ